MNLRQAVSICYNACMGKKRNKTRRDLAEIALSVVEQAVGEPLSGDTPNHRTETPSVRHGQPGGKKGGKARAEKLTPARRREIAKNAARARWKKDL